jgi:hypothetical protein
MQHSLRGVRHSAIFAAKMPEERGFAARRLDAVLAIDWHAART